MNKHHWLEIVYWISQVILTLVAIVAATGAFLQLRTYKLFEILKWLEDPEKKKARRIVIRQIGERGDEQWWMEESPEVEELERAAANVCAHYEIVGLIIEHDGLERFWPSYGAFFKRHWARSIVDCYNVLTPFLKYRRTRAPHAYSGFTKTGF